MKKKTKPKLKNYMVRVLAYAHVLVIDAEDEEKAMEYAMDISHGDLELDEASIEEEVSSDRLEDERRNADWIAEP